MFCAYFKSNDTWSVVIGEMILQLTFLIDYFQPNYPTWIFQPRIWQRLVKVMLVRDRARWWQTQRNTRTEHSRLIWVTVMKSDHWYAHTHSNNAHIETRDDNIISWTQRHIKRSQGSYTSTVVVFSVLVTLVLQVCGCHRKMYGPGCRCLPIKEKNKRETDKH